MAVFRPDNNTLAVIKLLKSRLKTYDISEKIGIFPHDYVETGLSRATFFDSLSELKKHGYVDLIDFTEEDWYIGDDGRLLDADMYPGDYRVKANESILKLADLPSGKIELKGRKIVFNDTASMIVCGKMSCPIEANTIHQDLCSFIFKKKPGELIDWEDAAIAIGRDADDLTRQDRRAVIDAIIAINKKVKRNFNTDDILIRSENKFIARNF